MLRLWWTATLSARLALGITCYDMNRDPAEDLIPCDTRADGVVSHSTCCNRGDICLASGLCLSTQDSQMERLFWLNGCTDRTFKNDRCFPQLCRDQIGTGHALTNFMACDGGKWCCASDGQSCCSNDNKAVLDQGVGTVVRQLPLVTSDLDTSTSSSSTTSTTSSSSSTTTTSSSSTTTSTTSLTTSTSSSAPACTSALAPSSTPSEPGIGASQTGLVAGLAVVATALAMSLLALGFLAHRLRKLRRREAGGATVPAPFPPQYAAPSYSRSQPPQPASPGSYAMDPVPRQKTGEYYPPAYPAGARARGQYGDLDLRDVDG